MNGTNQRERAHAYMNDINGFFDRNRDRRLLSVYYTAGYPALDDTLPIAGHLQSAGVDFLEIGIPYSDPVADGPVIQHSSAVALKNGMTLRLLFGQLAGLRERIRIPVFLMGYFNPILQYGVENFCRDCQRCGVNGVIIPDLPLYEYEALYATFFAQYGIQPVFLITPQTSEERIRKIDALSSEAFIYMLSSPSVTGNELEIDAATEAYFRRIQEMNLQSPTVIGFGITGREVFRQATDYANGAIVGSRFVQMLGETEAISPDKIKKFIAAFKV